MLLISTFNIAFTETNIAAACCEYKPIMHWTKNLLGLRIVITHIL